MRLKATGSRTTTPACPGVSRRKASQASTSTTTTPAAARTRQTVRGGDVQARARASSGSVGPNSSRTTDIAASGVAATPTRRGEPDDLQPALERLQREDPRLLDRGAEELGVVADVRGIHFGRSTPSASGTTSASVRWIAAP